MTRKYKPLLGHRPYKAYNEEKLNTAILDVLDNGMSVRQSAEKHSIPRKTLGYKIKGLHIKSVGGQTSLSIQEEREIIQQLLVCADWGKPLGSLDIRLIVQSYLQTCGRTVRRFKNNLPGEDWYSSFITRHKHELTVRKCQNISRARASVGVDSLSKYFDQLEETLKDIPKENILNFDETNLSDDPGSKKMVFRRGCKYPERVMNSSKGCISIMFAGSAAGELLPCYVVYRSEHLWTSWTEGGPPGTHYGRTISGWFDGPNFEEWFLKIVLPWAKRKNGTKCIIGDNLSSHLSHKVIECCQKENIRFIFLPPNATHICQPLDVSVFASVKRSWRALLTEFKQRNPSSHSLEKSRFPRQLASLMTTISNKIQDNLVSGFRKTGIYPLNREEVLSRIPDATPQNGADRSRRVSDTLLSYLKACRVPESKRSGPRKKICLPAGKSICTEDLQSLPSTSNSVDDITAEKDGFSSDSSGTEDKMELEGEPDQETEQHTPKSLTVGDFALIKIMGKK